MQKRGSLDNVTFKNKNFDTKIICVSIVNECSIHSISIQYTVLLSDTVSHWHYIKKR